MSITKTQLKELADVMLKELPRPPLASLINCGADDPAEIDCMAKYVRNNYSTKEVLAAFDKELKTFKHIFGDKNGDNKTT